MLRVGDKVHHWNEMHLVGVVEKLNEVDSGQWMVGGAAGKRLFAAVRYDNGKIRDISVNDLILVTRP